MTSTLSIIIPRISISLIVLLILFGCSKKETVAPQPLDPITSEEYAVLATIVDTLLSHMSVSTIVVQDSTSSGIHGYNSDSSLTSTLQYVNQHVPIIKAETMLDFKTKNLTRTYIQNPSKINPACVYSSSSKSTYPICDVSRVGFSSDGQQALAYVGCIEAPLAGAGVYYVLSRDNAKWKIIGSVMIWIS